MNAIEKAAYLQEKIDVCHPTFEDLNVTVKNISISPLEDEYLIINYLLFRNGRQSKQWVNIVISLFNADGDILQVDNSLQFELKKRCLPYVGSVHVRLKYPFDNIAKIGVYLQEL